MHKKIQLLHPVLVNRKEPTLDDNGRPNIGWDTKLYLTHHTYHATLLSSTTVSSMLNSFYDESFKNQTKTETAFNFIAPKKSSLSIGASELVSRCQQMSIL